MFERKSLVSNLYINISNLIISLRLIKFSSKLNKN